MELIPLDEIELKVEEMYDDPEKGYNYARISIKPLNEGYGITIGNMLRRILLSSIRGVAPIGYRIRGFSHEFTALPGIYEDGLQITQNVKKLVVKMLGDEDFKILYVRKKGPAVVTAGDIAPSADVEIVNPDLRLFEITKDIEVGMEIFVAAGRGYMTEEEVKEQFRDIMPTGEISIDITYEDEEMPIHEGTIIVDAFFSPVRRVAYKVEPARVGRYSKYDHLIMEIWTNRAVSALDALKEAIAIIRERLTIFDRLDEAAQAYLESLEKRTEEKVEQVQPVTFTPIDKLNLSPIIVEILRKHGVDSVEALLRLYEEGTLSQIPHIGTKRMASIEAALEEWKKQMGLVEEVETEEATKVEEQTQMAGDLDQPVEVLGLPSTVLRILDAAGIKTIAELKQVVDEGRLTSIKGIGASRAKKIEEVLSRFLGEGGE